MKVVTNAMIFLGVCAGNIAGPFFYKSDQAPDYALGIWSMIVANFVESTLILFLGVALAWENHRRDRIPAVVPGDDADYMRQLELERAAPSDLTEKESMNFRYLF